jgi:hypothetical protein
MAIGRMTVLTRDEADNWTDRIIRYESSVDLGTWRNKVMLVADDEFSTNTDRDFSFQDDTEEMCADDGLFPRFVDYMKIYLHHYPFVGDLKPGARSDMIKEWTDGALLVNYVGHGSPTQLADERVMQFSDLHSLMNGGKQPIFLAFSCSVSDLDSPYHRSMGQEMVVIDNGGAIASIAGTGPTYGGPNRALDFAFIDYLFATKDSTYTEPIGIALQLAKMDNSVSYQVANSVKYVILGDPAMTLSLPRYTVEHNVEEIDTMQTGGKYSVEGSVIDGGRVLTSFNGTAHIVIQESMEFIVEKIYKTSVDSLLSYRLPGKELFRGVVDVTAGRFKADFTVPVRCRTGSRARVRSYVTTTEEDGVGAVDTLTIETAGSLPPNDSPPDINLYFFGQATKVKQGSVLNASIFDEDGIAILGSDPQSSIYLEFDGSGNPIFVTEYFEYEHGSSTTGHVEYPLHSGFSPGEHSVVMRAFDNLGLSSSDTLFFEVVEEGLYTISDIFNLPNPFSESTNFIFQLSGRADVTLRIFNVSGVEIWDREVSGQEGFNSIYWDGRDYTGDRLANGTYLYILDVEFRDSYHRSEMVKGKVVILR